MVPQVHLAFQDILLGARRSEDPWTSDGDNNEAGKGNGGAQQAAQVLEIVVASHVSRPFPSFDSCLSLSLSLSLSLARTLSLTFSRCACFAPATRALAHPRRRTRPGSSHRAAQEGPARQLALSPPRAASGADSFWLTEPIAARQPVNPDPGLINEDFKPTEASKRTFGSSDVAALWIGLVISVPAYYLAGSLVELGMSWWQGIFTVFVSNAIVLVPMVLNAHSGTKYGVPFPVLTRAAFGIRGATIIGVLRGLVACVWFGIQTWVGGTSLLTLYEALAGPIAALPVAALGGITVPQFTFFMIFWCIQVLVLIRGIESIRIVEKYSAPILIGLSAALLVWAFWRANGLGPMLSVTSQFAPGAPKEGQFLKVFLPSVTANVGFWSTLSLNIPDFTRYAKSQKAQLTGQAIGLPVFMALFSFLGVAVTSATAVIFGQIISDPVEVVSRIQGVLPTILSLVGLMLATISTNIAANVVAPANAMVNLAPRQISFTKGAFITAVLGIVTQPWRLLSSTEGYIFTWLIGYR